MMDRNELMQKAANKAVQELSWESIEFLFRPITGVDLLLRLNFEGMKQKIYDWCSDNSPSAMPHRFRPPYVSELLRAIKREEFYREMKTAKDKH